MRVRHKVAWRGSPNGIRVIQYQAGEVDDLPASLYETAVREGWAEPEGKAKPAPENRARAAPSNRARDAPAIKSVGGGWYELPSGERVRGREAAEARLNE